VTEAALLDSVEVVIERQKMAIMEDHRVPTPIPFFSTRGRAIGNHLNEEIAPSPTHWDRQAIQPNHIKFRTYSALAPMGTPPINESVELTQGTL
jgi:hypothetical protein